MPHPSKRKGDREEREIVTAWQTAGFQAQRVPLSGSAGGMFKGDVHIYLGDIVGEPAKFEAKIRANGFREIYGWLDGKDGLFLRADRRERLVVLRERDFIRLLRGERDNG